MTDSAFQYPSHIDLQEKITAKGKPVNRFVRLKDRHTGQLTGKLLDLTTHRTIDPIDPNRTSWGGDEPRWGGGRISTAMAVHAMGSTPGS